MKEQHQLRHLQVEVLGGYHEGALLVLLLGELVLASAVHGEVGELRHQPRQRGVLAVVALQDGQCRVVPEEADVGVAADLHLVARRIALAEADKDGVPIRCLQGALRLRLLLH